MTQQALKHAANDSDPKVILGRSVTQGFAGTLAIGVVSWIVLLLDRNLSLLLVGALCLVGYAAIAAIYTPKVRNGRKLHAILSGLIAGISSFVFTGSLVVTQPETLAALEGQQNQITLPGLLSIIGFTAALIVTGMIVAAILPTRQTDPLDSRAAFARVCAISYLPLILVGGIVTSTESGLAVPDSVTTYGSISVLFPLSLMDEVRIYLEHSHRIFGTFAGIATIILVVRLLATRAPMLPRVMSVALLLAVIAQGVMGALRVSEEHQALAAVHGVLAQLVFVLAIATGIVTSIRWQSLSISDEHMKLARSARTFAMITLLACTIQLVFGSLTRHTSSAHPLMSHVAFSFVVVVLCIIAGAKAIHVAKADDNAKPLRKIGASIHGIVVLQFTLGWGALAMTRTGDEEHAPIPTYDELQTAGGIRVPETLITSAHHVLGALLIAAIGSSLIWSIRAASRKA